MDVRPPYTLWPKALLTALLLSLFAASAQAAQKPFSGCKPISDRDGENGCWIFLTRPLGELPDAPIYWSLDIFPNRTSAEAAKGPAGVVGEALGKVWLFTVAEKGKLPIAGQRVTVIGPIPVKHGETYTAQFMEAIMPPGVPTRTHRHPGPEVFYTETGLSCLETPQGKQVGRKGTDIIIPEGQPMNLVTIGNETRRSIVLVLHSSSHAWMTVADDWTPKGLCRSDQE